MRIVRNYRVESPGDRGAVVAIGNFDGVHLGHQAVIKSVEEIAAGRQTRKGVVTFEPHPRQFFNASARPFRLTNSATRARRLETLGIELLFELEFNAHLSNMDPFRFSQEVLKEGLGISHAVIGEDFHYGHRRKGTSDHLEQDGAKLGFGVSTISIKTGSLGEYSSTSIRNALSDGRPGDASRLLGHWHRVEGEVLTGERRGRQLGFPTLNISLQNLHLPKFGVYAVITDVLTGALKGSYIGSASIGVRPTFGVNTPNLEVYLFDFQGEIYGEIVSVALVSFQREELKFEGVDDLIQQMREDCAKSRSILSKVTAES